MEDLNLSRTAMVATAYILAIREGSKRRNRIATQKYAVGSGWPEVTVFREGLAVLT
jgi:protein-tyrosine phosphatase